jgi:DNA topoisomerase VI subunit B
VAHSGETWYVAVVSAGKWAYENTKLNAAVSVIENMQNDEYHVLSKKLKSCARKLLTTIKRKMNKMKKRQKQSVNLCKNKTMAWKHRQFLNSDPDIPPHITRKLVELEIYMCNVFEK